jgi:hypothetical protein
MQFNKFLIELENLTETPEPNDSPILQSDINNRLAQELQDIIISPSFAFVKIRKVLYAYGLDMPTLYDIDQEGDELALELDDGLFVYILYYKTDDEKYDFYAEVTDWDGIDKLMSDEDEIEEE